MLKKLLLAAVIALGATAPVSLQAQTQTQSAEMEMVRQMNEHPGLDADFTPPSPQDSLFPPDPLALPLGPNGSPNEDAAAMHWSPVTEAECKVPTTPTLGPKLPPVKLQVQGVQGADVSEYEGNVDWAKLSAAKKFVIVRYSHAAHLDKEFATYWPTAKKYGVMRGAYHYLDPTSLYPFADQVRNFVKNVTLEKGELPPVLDLENPCLWVHMTEANRLKYVLKWADAFEKVYGAKPIIYMSPSFVDRALGGATKAAVLKNYPLWIANYRVPKPMIPAPWKKYIIWQYAEDANLPGVAIPADGDIAPGSLADLQKYTLAKDAGGDDSILTKEDLDDEGLTGHP